MPALPAEGHKICVRRRCWGKNAGCLVLRRSRRARAPVVAATAAAAAILRRHAAVVAAASAVAVLRCCCCAVVGVLPSSCGSYFVSQVVQIRRVGMCASVRVPPPKKTPVTILMETYKYVSRDDVCGAVTFLRC